MTTFVKEQATLKSRHKRHRSKEEIVANILKVAQNKTTKTRIMRRCYMSYNLLQKYLNYATVRGLLFHDHSSNEYHITIKGTQFLDYFHQYLDTENELVLKKRIISKMLEKTMEYEYQTPKPQQSSYWLYSAQL
ncbi:MAG: winged helix-turn-helix domain-containing protein [Thermoproteota archaeon]|nr:winged helix-turn-helix domain-containing protein [Thermoproteota archaeon]